ncbi:hypothetical protein [Streptomyces sp. Z26]|uniref:hypothetical protein n=1 Tax=Streptomyces sp. Z26 TaxID=2500177 RepID=UPI000EF1739E|nr:hypothetical protein [Streptomyces sp. Z26]RLL67005.1 hypothetical protein D7M15_09145 [Streptomyces sp. Z26]
MPLPEPVRRTVTPTAVTPARPYDITPAPPRPVAPAAARRIVGYQPYGGAMVPVYEVQQPTVPTAPRDLTPQPLLDPQAQRLLAGGLGAGAAGAGLGYGVGQILGAVAGLGTGGLLALVLLIAAARWTTGARTHVTVHQHAHGLFGRNHHTYHR